MRHEDSLRSILTKVAEEVAFMFADSAASGSLDVAPEDCQLVSIAYSGDHSGSVGIVAGRTFRHALRENMLGAISEGANADREAEDAFMELCNVLAGQWVTETYGTHGNLAISVPALTEVTPETWRHLVEHDATAPLIIDQEHVVLVGHDILRAVEAALAAAAAELPAAE